MAHWGMCSAPCTSGWRCVRAPAHRLSWWAPGHRLPDERDLVGALQKNGWTAYGTIGREPPNSAVRNGRTLPDCGVHLLRALDLLSDRQGFDDSRRPIHACLWRARLRITPTYTRICLDLDRNDQVYGLEVSDTIGPSLVQVMVGPGKAEAILHDSSRSRVFHRRPLAVRFLVPCDDRRLGLLSPRDRGASAVRRSRWRVRLRANFSRVDLDGSGHRPGNESRRRAFVAWWPMRRRLRCIAGSG